MAFGVMVWAQRQQWHNTKKESQTMPAKSNTKNNSNDKLETYKMIHRLKKHNVDLREMANFGCFTAEVLEAALKMEFTDQELEPTKK